jgi:hypothetical protein
MNEPNLEVVGAETAVALVAVAVIVGLIVWALLRATSRRVDIGVVVAVTILTAISIFGFIGTQAEALITLAGTGLGALAGAITNLLGGDDADQTRTRRVALGRHRKGVSQQEAGGQAGQGGQGGAGTPGTEGTP